MKKKYSSLYKELNTKTDDKYDFFLQSITLLNHTI